MNNLGLVTIKMFILHHGSHMKEVIDLTPHSSGDSSAEEVGCCFALLGPICGVSLYHVTCLTGTYIFLLL